MEITSKPNSQLNTLRFIIRSSSMTLPCKTKLPQLNKFSLPTTIDSLNSILPSSCPTELNCIQTNQTTRDPTSISHPANLKFVTNSTPGHARTLTQGASIDTSVKTATKPDTETKIAVKQTQGFLGFGNFYRQFIWHFLELAKPLNDLLKKD